MSDPWASLLQRDGPLTRELVLEPSKFGLGVLPAGMRPDGTSTSVCGFCSTGCGLNVHLSSEGEALGLSPAADYPVNLGVACPKGWEALRVLEAEDRAVSPQLRKEGQLQDVTWETALRTMSAEFKRIQKAHGDDSVAFLSTGQIVTEEMMLLGSLAKFGMGMLHGDGNTRQCMATAVVAYKQSFGFDAPPYTYQDFEESDCIVLVGANVCIGHPILWERILNNPNQPELIVVDPRRTETARAATQHLALAPKSDMTLFYGIARLLIERGAVDRDFVEQHTNDFEAFAQFVAAYDLARVAQETGLESAAIHRAADAIANGKRVSFWWTMGVNQSYQGVRTAQSLINLALMTGNIGRPGTGANSITGQCNAMGSRLFSNTTNLLGGRAFEDVGHRREVAATLDIDEGRIPIEGSWAYDQIVDGIRSGKIRGLWVVATNPAHSWIGQSQFREHLEKLDFLVVQDMYRTTETAVMADLLLPAAGWGEKDGTFINSERRFGLVKKVRRAPGQALSDFHIFRLVAEAWGCGEMFRQWTSPAVAFQFMKSLSAGRPCDITGIRDYQMLDDCRGIQWPYAKGTPELQPGDQRRLFEDGAFYHADKRAKFLFDPPEPMPEPVSDERPYLLLTGRGGVCQWHTQTRTAKSRLLSSMTPSELHVEIHPDDAEREGVESGDRLRIASVRGETDVIARLNSSVQRGQLFLPMHFAGANRLTLPHFDPHSRQPSYKDCAVSVQKLAPDSGSVVHVPSADSVNDPSPQDSMDAPN